MLRMTAIALAAVATVGIASLGTTTSAEAGWKRHHHGHWGHVHVHVRPLYYNCWRRIWVGGKYGYWKRINVCY